jgi:hypothetical protein
MADVLPASFLGANRLAKILDLDIEQRRTVG